MNSPRLLPVAAPLALLLLLAAASLFSGSVALSPAKVWATLLSGPSGSDAAALIVFETRLPALLTALLSGASLAVAGLMMQTVFANPLADPSVLGVNAGAGLGAAAAMLLCGGSFAAGAFRLSGFLLVVAAAFAGALAVIFLLAACSAFLRDRLMLVVAGLMISFLASALISILNFYATSEGVRSYALWGMGDFGAVSLARLPAFAACAAAGLLSSLLLAKPLNALLLGDDYAANLGVRVRAVRTLALLSTGFLAATVTALCGPVAFIGLAVPPALRYALRTADHRRLLPLAMLWGADVALLCNLLSRLPGDGGLLPLNAVTPLFGVPAVLWILWKERGRR